MHGDLVDIETFLRNVERDLDRPSGLLRPDTRFRRLPDWTSLQALIVVAGFQRDYGITMTSEAFDRAETLEDLYEVLLGRRGA
jgi:acyl carrier protein